MEVSIDQLSQKQKSTLVSHYQRSRETIMTSAIASLSPSQPQFPIITIYVPVARTVAYLLQPLRLTFGVLEIWVYAINGG